MNRLRRWMIEKFLPRYAHELLLDELAATDKRLAAARQTIAELSAENRALRFALRQIGRGCRTEREGAPPHESDEILSALPVAQRRPLLPVAALL